MMPCWHSHNTMSVPLARLWPFGVSCSVRLIGWRSGWRVEGRVSAKRYRHAASAHPLASAVLPFACMFVQQRTWRHAQILLLGALLAPGQRTVCAILRIAGLCRERHFVNYHRVLNRAIWHDRLVAAFVPRGPVLLGIDDTIERRRG